MSFQATKEEIMKAYRRLSRIYHPDKHAENKEDAELLFTRAKKACEGNYCEV
jgi:DnaJ-class molecular chaperone